MTEPLTLKVLENLAAQFKAPDERLVSIWAGSLPRAMAALEIKPEPGRGFSALGIYAPQLIEVPLWPSEILIAVWSNKVQVMNMDSGLGYALPMPGVGSRVVFPSARLERLLDSLVEAHRRAK